MGAAAGAGMTFAWRKRGIKGNAGMTGIPAFARICWYFYRATYRWPVGAGL